MADQMSLSEKADQLFRPSGFWLRVVPQIVAVSSVALAAGTYSMGDQFSLEKGGPIIAVLFLAIALSSILRYRRASRNHHELKFRFGAGYLALIDSGEIIVTPSSVLLTGAPLSLAKLHFHIDDLR